MKKKSPKKKKKITIEGTAKDMKQMHFLSKVSGLTVDQVLASLIGQHLFKEELAAGKFDEDFNYTGNLLK